MVAKKWRMNLHRSNEQSLVVKGDLPAPRGYELTTAQVGKLKSYHQ